MSRRMLILLTVAGCLAAGALWSALHQNRSLRSPPSIDQAPLIVRQMFESPHPPKDLDPKSYASRVNQDRYEFFESQADDRARDQTLAYLLAWGRWAAIHCEGGVVLGLAASVQDTFIVSCVRRNDHARLVRLLSESVVGPMAGGTIEQYLVWPGSSGTLEGDLSPLFDAFDASKSPVVRSANYAAVRRAFGDLPGTAPTHESYVVACRAWWKDHRNEVELDRSYDHYDFDFSPLGADDPKPPHMLRLRKPPASGG